MTQHWETSTDLRLMFDGHINTVFELLTLTQTLYYINIQCFQTERRLFSLICLMAQFSTGFKISLTKLN